MAQTVEQTDEFTNVCRKATMQALSGKVDKKDIENLLAHAKTATKVEVGVGGAGPAEATAKCYTVAIYGYVTCDPTNLDHKFEAHHWGLGLEVETSYGTMFTAYDDWQSFFDNVAGYHAQGIASGGGILQITWFTSGGTPVGQFNGVAAGIGAFEVGGKATWTKK